MAEEDTTETIEEAKQEETEDIEETEETAEAKPKKKKKVVRRRKTKKERENPLTTAIRLAVESGKVEFGARTGIAASILGKAKLFVIASNTPSDIRDKVSTYSKASSIPVIEFEGSTMELGSVCGRPFPISVLSVFEEGTSSIMDLAKKK
ncbi:MAG: 50S ribosomal protein L30e [Candidatus Micrarchaeota archaeon]